MGKKYYLTPIFSPNERQPFIAWMTIKAFWYPRIKLEIGPKSDSLRERKAGFLCADRFISHTIKFILWPHQFLWCVRDGWMLHTKDLRRAHKHKRTHTPNTTQFIWFLFECSLLLIILCMWMMLVFVLACVTWTKTIPSAAHQTENNENAKYQRWRSTTKRGYYFSLLVSRCVSRNCNWNAYK